MASSRLRQGEGRCREATGRSHPCRALVGFDPSRSLYVDDDEACLVAAREYGIATIIHSAKSSSQLPAARSASFTSVEHLPALLNGRA